MGWDFQLLIIAPHHSVRTHASPQHIYVEKTLRKKSYSVSFSVLEQQNSVKDHCLLMISEVFPPPPYDVDGNDEWDLKCVRFGIHSLRVESVLYSTLTLHMQVPLSFESRHSGDSSSRFRNPGMQSPMWGLDSLSSRGQPLQLE